MVSSNSHPQFDYRTTRLVCVRGIDTVQYTKAVSDAIKQATLTLTRRYPDVKVTVADVRPLGRLCNEAFRASGMPHMCQVSVRGSVIDEETHMRSDRRVYGARDHRVYCAMNVWLDSEGYVCRQYFGQH
jgi:hypothetical protein